MATKRAQFTAISRDLNQVFFEFPFVVPEYFALITRALIVLEGIALTGDKEFDLFSAAYPYAARHAANLFGARELATMLGEARAAQQSLRQLGAPRAKSGTARGSSSSPDEGAARRGLKVKHNSSAGAALPL